MKKIEKVWPVGFDLTCKSCQSVFKMDSIEEAHSIYTERCINGDMRLNIFCPVCHHLNQFKRSEQK